MTVAGALPRLLLAALALILAGATAFGHGELRRARAETRAWLAEPDLEDRLLREPDPERLRLRAARAVLAAELDPARPPGDPAADPAASAERLAGAARIAERVVARRPASWDAAAVLGAATYLSWSQARDPRLFTDYPRWQRPLERALTLGPGQREPARFLAAAYLEVWPALSAEKREDARRLLARVFQNRDDLSLLLSPWLDTAGSRDEAFSPIPEDPEAWGRVEAEMARRGDREGFGEARDRRRRALFSTLRRDLVAAGERLEAGALPEARALFLSVAARAESDARFAGLLAAALERTPPGPVDRQTAERLAGHLSWALDRCLYAECPLAPAPLKRLSYLARGTNPVDQALGLLFAGELPRAERLERSADAWKEEWAPYQLVKARVLAGRGRTSEAEEALERVHRSWEDRPLTALAERELARAAGDAGALLEAEERLAALSRSAWPATAWVWRRGRPRLELLPGRPARGLVVEIDSLPAEGAVVELRLDGAAVGTFPVLAPAAGGRPALTVPTPLGRGLHLLELDVAQGGRVLPGAVRLLEP